MAINIAELVKRHQLASLQDRIQENDDALDLSRGLWRPLDGELLPIPINTSRRHAYERALRMMQSLGPRVIETKTNAVIGDVTWTAEGDNTDEILANLDLRGLASNLLLNLITTGVAAGYVYDSDTGPRVTRLGGYVEPYVNPDDIDEVLGLYQAWQVVRESDSVRYRENFPNDSGRQKFVGRWTVRVYDWSDSPDGTAVMRQWDNLVQPYAVGGPPSDEAEIPRPRYAIRNLSQEGLPVGELVACMPQFKALWATEARMALSEELAAFPMLKAIGSVDTEDLTVGASEVITAEAGSTVEWMEPGNLEELRRQRELRLERLTSDLMLPVSFATTQAISADSMRERNIAFRQNTDGYARDLSRLLSELVGNDFVTAVGGEPAGIVVLPTLAYDEAERIRSVIELYREGLLPLPVAAGAIQPFFPTWADEDFNDWVSAQSRVVTPDDLRAAFATDGEQ